MQHLSPLSGKCVVLAVTGGIAAYKAAELLRLLRKAEASVHVIMTRAATAFVTPLTFEALSGHRVYLDVLALGPGADAEETRIEHVALARQADVVVVAPATADFLARTAAGRAADALGAFLLSTRAPIVVAPAMEQHMWEHPATQDNVLLLSRRGVHFVGPDHGALASGAQGAGRLAPVEQIMHELEGVVSAERDLADVRIVVSSGPTREPIDPVRYISNRSSGRMGYLLASQAHHRGAFVSLVHGPTALQAPAVDKVIAVETAVEMHAAMMAEAEQADVVIMAAAVADYAAKHPAAHKLSKSERILEHIELERNPDILASLGAQKGQRTIVGFAAETDDVVAKGRQKLVRKGADLLVANIVGTSDSGFDVDTNRATLLFADGSEEDLGLQSKQQLARIILDAIVRIQNAKHTT